MQLKLMDLMANSKLVKKETSIIVSNPLDYDPSSNEIRTGTLLDEKITEWGSECVYSFSWVDGVLTVLLK